MLRRTVLALLIVGLAGCAGEGRPSVAEWEPHWDRVISGVPTLDDLDTDDPKALCDTALALVREERIYLIPAPELPLDDPVDDWLSIADETFFECPPRSGEIQGFEEAYSLLDDYHAEVRAALDN